MLRLIHILLKYTPFVLTVLMIAHTALLLGGTDASILSHACLSPLTYALYMALSVKLHFCRWHRAALTYVFAMYVCVVGQGYNLFAACGIDVRWARLAMLIAGVAVITGFITSRIYGHDRERGACGSAC